MFKDTAYLVLDKAALCVLGSSVRMAIHQTKHQTDLEKRLRLIRRQVYGKEHISSIMYQVSGGETKGAISHNTKYIIHNTDLASLHHDLLKILIFASIAIGSQTILYFLLKNHILNINFF